LPNHTHGDGDRGDRRFRRPIGEATSAPELSRVLLIFSFFCAELIKIIKGSFGTHHFISFGRNKMTIMISHFILKNQQK
jgi:hypothetical protein